tara:strand:- start:827 stop:1654 length:828 start_codon:yes stop_codon:yes gene_type:complete
LGKILRNNRYSKILLILTFMVLYFTLVFLNAHSQTFKQYFASKFYQPVEVTFDEKYKTQMFSCLALSCVQSASLYLKKGCGAGTSKLGHVYKVDDKTYPLTRHSYSSSLNCKDPKTAFYFPLIPSWSVADKSPLVPVKSFLKQFAYLLALYAALISFWIMTKIGTNSSLKELYRQSFSFQNKVDVLLASILIPLVMTASYYLIFKSLLEVQWKKEVLEITFMLFIFTPSFLILLKYPSQWKKKLIGIPVMMIFILVAQRIIELSILHIGKTLGLA